MSVLKPALEKAEKPQKPSKFGKLKELFAKNKKLFIIPVAIIVLLALLLGLVVPKLLAPKASGSSVQSSTVQKGTVSVTVTGTGTLASSDDVSINIPNGVVVKKVLVQSGETVKKGQKLASVTKESAALALLDVRDQLDDVEDQLSDSSSSDTSSDEYLESVVLKGQKKKLEKAEDILEDLVSDPYIKATSAGTVGTVSISDGSVVGSGTSSTSSSSSAGASAMPSKSEVSTTSSVVTLAKYVFGSSAIATTADVKAQAAGLSAEVGEDGTVGSVSVAVTAPVTGATPETSIGAIDAIPNAQISWSPSASSFAADTAYTATIVLDAADGLTFSTAATAAVPGAAEVTQEVIASSNDRENARLIIKARFDKTAAESSKQSDSSSAQGGTAAPSGNGASSTGSSSSGSSNAQAQGGSSSFSAGSVSSSSGAVSSSADASSSSLSVDDYSTTVIGISSGGKVCVSINVDEADITAVSVDQSATVTVDAASSDSFEGKVVEVSTSSSSTSGSVKYTAKVEIEKTDDMMIGMSASAVINVKESSENALTIPVSALQESGNRTFVYTKSDNDGNLSGEVDVTTGVSDGSTVEITEGLNEGDTVYYVKSASSGSSENGGFDFGSMGGMSGGPGNMPGGGSGNMPNFGSSSSSSDNRPSMPSGSRPSAYEVDESAAQATLNIA